MDKNKLNKIIDTSRDDKNHLWTAFIVLISGSVTLLMQTGTSIKSLFAVVGLLFSILLFVAYFNKSIQIDKFEE